MLESSEEREQRLGARLASLHESRKAIDTASDHELLWAWTHYEGVECMLSSQGIDQDVDERMLVEELYDRGYAPVIG